MNESLIYGVVVLALLTRLIPMMILKGYLWRWHLVPRNKVFNVYLHVMIGNDDRVYHDHPWRSVSLCLWGTLRESLLDPATGELTYRYLKPGSIIQRGLGCRHFLALGRGSKVVVTLFVTGPMLSGGAWYFYQQKSDTKYRRVPYWDRPAPDQRRWCWSKLRYMGDS